MAPSPDPRPTAPASGEAPAARRRGSGEFSWARFNDKAFASLIVAMLGVMVLVNINQTSNRITRVEDRITRLEERITRVEIGIARLDERITKFEEAVDARFKAMDARFEAMDARFAEMENTQQEILLTLARLVTLLEPRDGVLTVPDG